MTAFACVVEMSGFKKIGLFLTRAQAEKSHPDSPIVEVEASRHLTGSLTEKAVFFTQRDQSWCELRQAIGEY